MRYDKESGELAVSLTEWVMLARRGISTAQPIEEEEALSPALRYALQEAMPDAKEEKLFYSFEGEGQKVLIFTNVPKRMLFAEEKTVSHLDNGDTVDGYKIFSGLAFLAGLERNTLERKMNGD